MNVRDLTPHLGAEITGVDLARGLSSAITTALLRALDTRGVVVMRGQSLTPEQFMALSHGLGVLERNPWQQFARPGFPELMVISNIVENGEPIGAPDFGRQWQSSGAHLKTPYRATLQYAVEIPLKDGVPLGDITFASTRAAYDALDPRMQQQLHGMVAVNVGGKSRKKRSTSFWLDSGMTQGFHGGVDHPVARPHPRTGQKCLYVSAENTSFIRGLHDQYSTELLDQLFQHMTRPEFIYRHPWQAGDLVMWDHCSTQHRAERDYEPPLRRMLYRTVLKGVTTR